MPYIPQIKIGGTTYDVRDSRVDDLPNTTLAQRPVELSGINLDDITEVGIYWHGTNSTAVINAPENGAFVLVVFNNASSNYRLAQVLFYYSNGNKVYYRNRMSTQSFEDWERVATNSDIEGVNAKIDSIYTALTGIAEFENIHDNSTFKTGGYYAANGTITTNVSSCYSEMYIPVNEGIYYCYFASEENIQIILGTYDLNKNWLDRVMVSGDSFSIGSNVKYIRVSIYNGASDANTFTLTKEKVSKTLEHIYKLLIPDDIIVCSERTYSSVPAIHDAVTVVQGYYNDNGHFVENEGYTSYVWEVKKDCYGYFNSNLPYRSICVFEKGTHSFIPPRLRYNSSEDTEPKIDSKISLKAGQIVAVTTTSSVMTDFYTNDTLFKVVLADNVYLQEKQINQIMQYTQKDCRVQHYQNGLYIYTPTGLGYLRYAFKHDINAPTNCDTWRVDGLYSVDNEFNERFRGTTGGEWECAVSLSGRPDYSGGRAHGNEVTTNIVFVVDGVAYSDTNITSLQDKEFKELRILETSNLYDPADNETVIAVHTKEYLFTEKNLHLLQHLDWQISDTLSACYLAMLTPSKLYTDMFYSDKNLTPIASLSAYGNHYEISKAVQYSANKGFICSLEILQYPTGLPGSNTFNMRDNSGGDYHKMYFNVCTSGEITAGTRWTAETVYTFAVGEPITTD